jgi:PadR family transcriptional regulator, regulatory protein PadR
MTARKKASSRAEVDGQLLDVSFVRLYILYRSDVEPFSSSQISEELAKRGLLVGTRSISQLCRGLQNNGLLMSAEGPQGQQRQTVYRPTRHGRLVIEQARGKLRYLFDASY